MYTFVDLFCGFGGLTQALVLAGFTPLGAANHNRYKVEILIRTSEAVFTRVGPSQTVERIRSLRPAKRAVPQSLG